MSKGWTGRKVFLTGHTGFKGGWLALWLTRMGAEVRGYGLDPATEPSLFATARVGELLEDVRGDLKDAARLEWAIRDFAPEVVFHLAAQPLVRASYADPIGTYETNVMGTARVLDVVRRTPEVMAVVCVTTDKCYENREWEWGYRETDALGGYDPYSSSKACAEVVAAAFRSSYFAGGNVMGGGDGSSDRLIPDLVRGFAAAEAVRIRRPRAIRPWQHVLEPLAGYIALAERLLGDEAGRYATAYNFGPAEDDAKPVSWIAERMAREWGEGASWVLDEDEGVHEAGWLKLDASRARAELGWRPKLHLGEALDWVVRWYRAEQRGEDMRAVCFREIAAYEALTGGGG
jgi:CDP-glucose 4,6-dehydratase